MPYGYTYMTIDGKIIGLPDISYIDALLSHAENGSKYYRIVKHNDSVVIVEHADEILLKKDRRRLKSKWDKYFKYKRFK